jgi:hypothetical protein
LDDNCGFREQRWLFVVQSLSAIRACLTIVDPPPKLTTLIIMAMTFGLILPRMLFERVLPAPAEKRHGRSTQRSAVQD